MTILKRLSKVKFILLFALLVFTVFEEDEEEALNDFGVIAFGSFSWESSDDDDDDDKVGEMEVEEVLLLLLLLLLLL